MALCYCSKCLKPEDIEWGVWVGGKFYCIDCAPHDFDEDEDEEE